MDSLTYIGDAVDSEVSSEIQEDFIIALFVVVFDTKRGMSVCNSNSFLAFAFILFFYKMYL